MLNIASSDSLVNKLTLTSDLNDLLMLNDYGCLFVAKLNWKKFFFFFFLKAFVFFTKYTLKIKFVEKNINENVKDVYLISEIYSYTGNVCVTNKI